MAGLPTRMRTRPLSSGDGITPVEAREVPNPDWLVIPERGLYRNRYFRGRWVREDLGLHATRLPGNCSAGKPRIRSGARPP